MANWSSNHLPLFTLRYCVETNSPPVCGGEREEEGERIIILGCPVKTRDRASWKGQVQMDTIHLGDQEEVRSPRCSFWAWEDPFWLPSGFKCKRLQGRCHVSSQGLDSAPALISMRRIAQLLVRASHPCWALLSCPLHLSSILEVSCGPILSCGCERGSWNFHDRGLLVLCEHPP